MVRKKANKRAVGGAGGQATPTRLTALARSDGLVLRVGTADTEPDDALRMARKIVRDELPGRWTVKSMGAKSRDFAVRRPRNVANPTVPQAFDFSYRLREHRDVEDCEPALVLPVAGPDAMRAERVAAAPRSSTSFDGDDLPCASAHRWALDLCGVRDAWSLSRPSGGKSQGEGVTIGHPDTGYTDHPQLGDPARLLKDQGFDFEDGDSDARDALRGFSGGHGTSTASVIISGVESGPGITGVAPRSKLVPLRVTTSVVLLSFSKLAAALRFAADNGHHVVSISLGGPVYSRFLHRAVQHAVERGCIVVCAAGNVWPFVVYPARLDEVIAAAACNCRQGIWADSASGPAVDITAPGQSVWRALAEQAGFSISQGSGTSFATAITAGVAALWLAHHGRDQLIARYGARNLASVFKELLLTKGFDRPAGWMAAEFGAGILNARKLLSAALPSTPPAGGLRALHASAVPRSKSQLDEILELFPAQDPAHVRAALLRLLRVDERQLPTVLRDVGDEIAYHAVTDMDFRQRLMARPTARAARTTAAAGRVLPRRMSARLRRMVAKSP